MTKKPHTPDSLADRLDELMPPGKTGSIRHDDDPLTAAAAQVANTPLPALSPEAMQRIQARLTAPQRAPVPVAHPRGRITPLLRWALVASFAFAVLFAASIPPALASVPGDALYPLKQAIERVEITLATAPAAQASVYLTFAERRLSEARILLERGSFQRQMFDLALENMQMAATTARQAGLDTTGDLQERTITLTARMNLVLYDAAAESPAVINPVINEIRATQDGGGLLLPPPPMPTATPQPPTPQTMTEPSVTASSAAPTATDAAAPTVTPTALPVTLVIEGPVEAINGNIIIIYGLEVELPPGHPLLQILRPGDTVQVGGSVTTIQGSVTAVEVDLVSAEAEISPDGQQVWRDSGDCANPPPAWAPAHGWRARCEGGAQPGGQGQGQPGGGNQGSPPGQGQGQPGGGNQGQPPGQGQGQGQGQPGGGNQGQGQGQGRGRGNN